ncbi:thiamine pyrophosphate-binding protein [Wenxinia marina]|uniref:Thiamine pyrophosphate-requiring enzyme n=1 Tax=Wenxinia marina DSM 24838 TaxID=1123501 RepID=A0A0D0PC09_9RHOB|nr:thiamine pyrophosphate-binding protein [Wenxinia marina]KIQ69006.1 Thiamine pyrophosphate-requiring enzyme [Wenxinia marina DSM 24838]GGL81052.1 acetolactate synthase large subunit [Wenxinia marina]
MERICAQIVIDCLALSGVTKAFGIASGKMMPLMRALSEQNRIRFIGVRHEQAAAMMATGVALGTGQIACAFGELGPGGSNLVPGVANAFADNVPLIVITTGNASHLTGPDRGTLMDLDLVELFRPITKSSLRLTDGRRAPEVLRRAIREARTGRPGPVHVNIPADILGGTYPYDPRMLMEDDFAAAPRPFADPALIAEAAACLAAGKRPLVIAGGGVVRSGAADALMTVADRLGAAATATQMGIGTVPTDHPAYIGHGGIIGGAALVEALQTADVVLAVGCRFSSWLWGANGPLIAADARLVQIDTDPAAFGRNVPVTVGIHADAKAALTALANRLNSHTPPKAVTGWRDMLTTRHRAELSESAGAGPVDGLPHPARYAELLNEMLPQDALVTYDGGHTTFWHNERLSAPAPRTRFHAPGLALLGVGLPYAIGLKAAYPDRQVICTVGDGSVGFTVQELDTALRYRLPVITVVHNNAAWGVIRAGQQKHGFDFETDLSGTDYAAIARGFGCVGHTVRSEEEFRAALSACLAEDRPSLIDCLTTFQPHPAMKYFGAAGAPRPADVALPY